ncbi:MAG: 50S ribosomal protein L29 [Acidimicrobiales bacterium]
MAKAESVTNLDDVSLAERLAEAKLELFNLRFQHVTGQLDNSSRLKATRKLVARITTELRAREIAAAEAMSKENA